jgi:hypothetical protein
VQPDGRGPKIAFACGRCRRRVNRTDDRDNPALIADTPGIQVNAHFS